MGIFAIISLVMSAIQVLPSVIKIIKDIIAMLHSLRTRDGFDKGKFVADLREALQAVTDSHDASKLESLASGLKKTCEGAGCPSDIVH